MPKFKKGHKGYWLGKKKPHTEETKEKIRASLIGHPVSEETRKKLAEKSVFQKGFTPWNKGRPRTEEVKKKISIALKEKGIEPKEKYRGKGSAGANWKGGVTPENHLIRNGIEMRLWREAVFARDNWTCQKTGEKGGRLHPHHIQNFADHPELRFAIDNGITLSARAHREFHKKYGVKNNTRGQLEEFLAGMQHGS